MNITEEILLMEPLYRLLPSGLPTNSKKQNKTNKTKLYVNISTS